MAASTRPARTYSSPRRQAAAAATRDAILDAALALFTERGYVATTVDHIAERAGVSKPTVFTSVGSKATIIRELRARALAGSGDVEGPPEAQAWWREAIDAPDPVHAVKLWARNMAEVAERLWPIYNPLRAAAGTDAEVRETWEEHVRQRRSRAQVIVDSITATTALRPGLTRSTAADIVVIFMTPDTYEQLVVMRGWSRKKFEQWVARSLYEQLFGQRMP